MTFTVLYDEPHEAIWFKKLHPALNNAPIESLSSAWNRADLRSVLAYDRPDIVLLKNSRPILVVEETVEVPSGHNVGQRFARLAAAAEASVPVLYFGPYAAKKHGGDTAGPRFMNLRLFQALDAMTRVTGTAITTINWPVDINFEVRRDNMKDAQVREYMSLFMALLNANSTSMNSALLQSDLQKKLTLDRNEFVRSEVKRASSYDNPPSSVVFFSTSNFSNKYATGPSTFGNLITEIVCYQIGMNNIRSDPYTGMAILYQYLYIKEYSHRALVLWFPNISKSDWRTASQSSTRKDIRLFRIAADAILFKDGLVMQGHL